MMAGVTPPPLDPDPATTAARVLVQGLAALGVEDVVLAPGSRSAPLAYALADAARPDDVRPVGAPRLRLHVRVDERSAAFLAVGLMRASAHRPGDQPHAPRPVAVVTTSGTAVANLHPAVLEAHHSGLPLILLTADRPHELRGTGANQTTDQVGIFAGAVRLAVTCPPPSACRTRPAASAAPSRAPSPPRQVARTGDPGPAHLDLAFREPLAPGGAPWPEPSTEGLTLVQARHVAPASTTGAWPTVDAARRREGAWPPCWSRGTARAPRPAGSRRPTAGPCWPSPRPAPGRHPRHRGPPSAARAPAAGGSSSAGRGARPPTLSRPVQQLLARQDSSRSSSSPLAAGATGPTPHGTRATSCSNRRRGCRQGRMPAPAGCPDAWRTADAAARCRDRTRCSTARRRPNARAAGPG